MIRLDSLYLHFVSALLISSIVFPVAFTPIKMFIIVIVLGLVWLKYILGGEVLVSIEVLFCSLFFSLLGMFYVVYGAYLSNPGSKSLLTVLVIYPMLFTLGLANFRDVGFYKVLRVFRIASLLLILSQVVFILSSFNIVSSSVKVFFNYLYPLTSNLSNGDGFFLFSLPNVSGMLFLLPFFLVNVLSAKRVDFVDLSFFIVMAFLILLTGRRSIFVSVGVGVLFSFTVVFLFSNQRMVFTKRLLVLAFLGFVLFVFLLALDVVNVDFFLDNILTIFDFSSDKSNLERVYQFHSLMSGFYDSPIFGQGAGAVASYIRSTESPWNYELFYVNLLFQVGVLGFLSYILGTVFLIYKSLKVAVKYKRDSEYFNFVVSLTSGFVGFMVANATNPYLLKFDYMWVFFIFVLVWNESITPRNHAMHSS